MKKSGVIYTKDWIANLMLDLSGYKSSEDLVNKVAIEPSCGEGVFVVQMVKRLIDSCKRFNHKYEDMIHSIIAIDLCSSSLAETKKRLRAVLDSEGLDSALISLLISNWIIEEDFLLSNNSIKADYVIGNPPYIRSNDIQPDKKATYLEVCKTMTPGSDLFIGFYEKGLSMLKPFGKLAFICADRWLHNSYGKKLRRYITEDFSVQSIMVMHEVEAFESDVSAYPAITVIAKDDQGTPTYIETTAGFNEQKAAELMASLETDSHDSASYYAVGTIPRRSLTEESWPLLPPDQQAILCDLEERFPTLESLETETYVGIGMATGNDKVFLVEKGDDVEPECMVPMITSRQLSSNSSHNNPLWLINPWNDDGTLIDLSKKPALKKYFHHNRAALEKRHIAKKNPDLWYRTIDKYHPELTNTPKLLIQDMHVRFEPYYDDCHYPHGNLYYITSNTWDLQVLGGLLMSSYCELFIDAYGIKMRGGTLRFQAQFLRKIRTPYPDSIPENINKLLKEAFIRRDYRLADEAASFAFGYKENRIAV